MIIVDFEKHTIEDNEDHNDEFNIVGSPLNQVTKWSLGRIPPNR